MLSNGSGITHFFVGVGLGVGLELAGGAGVDEPGEPLVGCGVGLGVREPIGAGAVELPGDTVPVPPAAGVVTDEPGLFVAEPVPDFVLPVVVFEPWPTVAGLPGFAGGTCFVRTGESVPFVLPTRGMPVTAMPRR